MDSHTSIGAVRSPREKLRHRIHEVVEVARPDDRLSRMFDLAIISLIGLNVVALTLETVEGIHGAAPALFRSFEVVSVAVFSVEYALRVWSCTADSRFRRPITGRLRYAVTPLVLIDLIAILPFYVPVLGLDLRSIRVLRLARVFRLLKLARYSRALQLLGRAVVRARAELGVTGVLGGLILIMASTLIYFAENHIQPEAFPNIPAAMWWAVATLTTVGYGDVYPVTPFGRLVGSFVALLGIGLIALPTGILGASFLDEFREDSDRSDR